MKNLFFGVVVGVAVLAGFPVAHAANAAGSDGAANNAREPEGLPPAPKFLAPPRRDESGRIVPITSPPNKSPAMGRPRAQVVLGDTSPLKRLQNGKDHARRAALVQTEIDRVLQEGMRTRKKGVGLDDRGLTPHEVALLRDLERRHRKVLAHERAQYFTAIPHARAPEFWFATGPGNRRFVVAGLTRFDLSPVVGNIDATIQKFGVLKRAALASRAPSARDLKVAAELDRLIAGLRRH